MKRAFAVALLLTGCRGELDAVRPGPPEQVRLETIDGATYVYWSAVPSATQYYIYLAPADGVTPENYAALGGLRETSDALVEILTAIDEGEMYSIVVTAVVGGRETAPSARVRLLVNESLHWLMPADLVLSTGGTSARFGASLASADLDADGYDDLVIGAPGLENGRGSVSVYQGGPSGLRHAWTVLGGSTGVELGFSVAAGDTNADGFADVLAGAPGGSRALLWRGASQLSGGPPAFNRTGTPGGRYGVSVGLMGHGGFAVGETDDTVGSRVYRYGGTTLTTNWSFSVDSRPQGPRVPMASPDFDGDGTGDVLIGAPGDDAVAADGGSARVWLGPTTSGAAPLWTETPGTVNGFGESVAVLDLDGDGFDDVAAGAPATSGSAGVARIFFGDSNGISTTTDGWLGNGGDRMGASLAAIPDADFDGISELAIGAPSDNIAGADRGAIHIAKSSGSDVFVGGAAANVDFGAAVAGGDLNGDGLGDLVVGAPLDGNGTVQIFFARSTRGPMPNAGFTIRGSRNEIVFPVGATFSDPVRTTYTCSWYWAEDPTPTVISPCTPGGASATLHVFPDPGRYPVRLRVTAADGRWAEAATTAIIE